MKAPLAVKTYIEKDGRKVTADEMVTFWKACTGEERQAFGKQAAKNLDVPFEE